MSYFGLKASSKSPTQDLTSTFCDASLANESSHPFAYLVLHVVEVLISSLLRSQCTYMISASWFDSITSSIYSLIHS